MQKEFYNLDREVKASELISSEFANFQVDGENVGFMQSFRLSYGLRVEPKFEGGSANMFFVFGQSSGQLGIGRLVGVKGFFAGIKRVNCGELQNLSLVLEGNQCGVNIEGNSALSMQDAILNQVGVSYSVGELDVQETFSYIVATLLEPDNVAA